MTTSKSNTLDLKCWRWLSGANKKLHSFHPTSLNENWQLHFNKSDIPATKVGQISVSSPLHALRPPSAARQASSTSLPCRTFPAAPRAGPGSGPGGGGATSRPPPPRPPPPPAATTRSTPWTSTSRACPTRWPTRSSRPSSVAHPAAFIWGLGCGERAPPLPQLFCLWLASLKAGHCGTKGGPNWRVTDFPWGSSSVPQHPLTVFFSLPMKSKKSKDVFIFNS